MNISIGICVYNEEKNISRLLDSLMSQKTNVNKIKEIIVVSSACTDKTNDIVKNFIKKDKRIRLIKQEKREGKASAINLFLREAKGDIIVLQSGDTVAKDENCIENLCKPFLEDEQIYMTGGHPIPTNDPNTFLGYIIHMWWYLHNELPRYGEIIAFRNIIKEIPIDTAVDEAYIESEIRKPGYKLMPVNNAIIYNKGADTLKDLLKQRRRVYVGHVRLKKEQKYKVKSFNFLNISRLIIKYLHNNFKIKYIFWIFGGILVEIYGRVLGMYDLYILKKNPYIWDVSKSTKSL